MNILLVSGSPKKDSNPKKNSSASKTILLGLGQLLVDRVEPNSIVTHRNALDADLAEKAAVCDVLVLAFPLYIDGIPGHLLSVMEKLERGNVIPDTTRIYAIVNCGFYEGEQCELALEMAQHWCARCGAVWGGGLGFGGGGGLGMMDMAPMGYGPKKNLGDELRLISDSILGGSDTGVRFAHVNFPAFMYKLGAQSGWVQAAKANGLKRKDLSRRL